MPEEKPFTSYDEAWEYLYGLGGVSARAEVWFTQNFPQGHDTSIRPFAQMMHKNLTVAGYECELKNGTQCSFHIRALALVMKYGVDYTPDLSKRNFFRKMERQPDIGQCFNNSRMLMDAVNKNGGPLSYVEGLVWGYLTNPVLHAWNAYDVTSFDAIDWSHYLGCEWNRYIGVPFSEEEYTELQSVVFPDEPSRPISLFDGQYFPLVEEHIHRILATREPAA